MPFDYEDIIGLAPLSSPPPEWTGATPSTNRSSTPIQSEPTSLHFPFRYSPGGPVPKTPSKKQRPPTIYLRHSPIQPRSDPLSPFCDLRNSPIVDNVAGVSATAESPSPRRLRTFVAQPDENEPEGPLQQPDFGTEKEHDRQFSQAQSAKEWPAQDAIAEKHSVFAWLVDVLNEHGYSWGEFILFMSGPRAQNKQERYRGFFANPTLVMQVLDTWVSSQNSRSGRQTVQDWAIRYLEKVVNKEAHAITKSGLLRSTNKPQGEAFVMDFDYLQLSRTIMEACPIMTQLMRAFATTTRQKTHLTEQNMVKKETRLGTSLFVLLGDRSQKNSYQKQILGLYLYASGAQRQVMSVLAEVGLCGSYPSIVGNESRKQEVHRPGVKDKLTLFLHNIPQLEGDSENQKQGDSDSDSDFEPDSGDTSDDSCDELDSSDEETDSDISDFDSDEWAHNNPNRRKGRQSVEEVDLGAALTRIESEYMRMRCVTKSRRAHVDDEDEDAPPILPSCERGDGLLKRLSLANRAHVRDLASETELGIAYDNMNLVNKIAEQIIGRKDSQENGTCATAFPLFDARREDMQTQDLLASLDKAPPLSIQDILLSQEENAFLERYLQHCILEIVVLHGGASFERFREGVFTSVPESDEKIELHKTDIYPLPAMNIDESSITGNADVLDTVRKELGKHLDSPLTMETVDIIFGDQLSMSRSRSVTGNRVGHDNPRRTHINTIEAPGFFHYLMNLTSGIFETHFGDPSLGARDPASLSSHNITLDRKPVTKTSPPPYRVARDLIFVSLYARLLHCLEIVTDCDSLDEYAEKVTSEQLQDDVAEVYRRFVKPQVVADLRRERNKQQMQRKDPAGKESAAGLTGTESLPLDLRQPAGDMVLENAVLFNRDALSLFAFTKSIKEADSGLIIILIKLFALAYRGMHRPKYSLECLIQIHNLTHIWPKALRRIVTMNWLLNPTGRTRSFVPVDLVQEHLIYWIKIIYSAQGSNASLEWLEKVTPCINTLRHLATQLNSKLGSKQGNKHQTPKLDNDIRELVKSLRMHRVYIKQNGRTLDGAAAEVPNVVSLGFQQLAGPLRNYNTMFERMRLRRRMTPLIGDPIIPREVTGAPMADVAAHADAASAIANATDIDKNKPHEAFVSSGPANRCQDSSEGEGEEEDYDSYFDQSVDLFLFLDTAEEFSLDI